MNPFRRIHIKFVGFRINSNRPTAGHTISRMGFISHFQRDIGLSICTFRLRSDTINLAEIGIPALNAKIPNLTE